MRYRLHTGPNRQVSSSRWMLTALALAAVLALSGCMLDRQQGLTTLPDWMMVQPDRMRLRERNETVMLSATGAKSAAAQLLYSTYLGGDGADYGKDVAVDAAGNLYIIGQTFSDTLFDVEIERAGYSDIFVAKLDPTGSEVLFSVILGGEDSEYPLSIEVDAQGNLYGTATVFDETFPTTPGALWPAPPESTNTVLFKLDSSGAMLYSTYLPLDSFYSKKNLAVDAAGNAYVAGSYPWVEEDGSYFGSQIALVKLDPTGAELLLDRHFGGTGSEQGSAIALDSNGHIYLTGTTSSGDGFPVTDNAHQPECGDLIYDPDSYCFEDGVAVVLDAAGEIIYASYHGGSFTDDPQAIVADGKGNFVITGDTTSAQFPLVNALQESCPVDNTTENCSSPRGFVSAVHFDENEATLTYSTYLGSSERNSNNVVLAAAMDHAGNVYISGYTSGKKFPRLNAIQEELSESICYTFSSERYCFEGFVVKFSPTGALLMGTYIGGVFDEYPHGIAVDNQGNVYVTGTTEADDFPTTENAYQRLNQINDDAFLVKINTITGTAPPPAPLP